jgi:hypothetical protein
MLSICIVHHARSLVEVDGKSVILFPRCVDSINAAVEQSGIRAELVVADWPMVPQAMPLREWLLDTCRVPVRVLRMHCTFSKGLGCNQAAQSAQSDSLLFLDCDMLISSDLLIMGMQQLAKGKAWFPGYVAQQGYESERYAPPKTPAAGNAFMTREIWQSVGRWPEKTTWGNFDQPVAQRVIDAGLSAEPLEGRATIPGFIHMWHPKFIGWEGKD